MCVCVCVCVCVRTCVYVCARTCRHCVCMYIYILKITFTMALLDIETRN